VYTSPVFTPLSSKSYLTSLFDKLPVIKFCFVLTPGVAVVSIPPDNAIADPVRAFDILSFVLFFAFFF
jgi:hypothetical protein